MLPTKKTVSEAGGISKVPILRFIVVACWTDSVVICAYTVQNIIVVAQIGNIRITSFTSSTSVRVDNVHLFDTLPSSGSLIAALSRNLHN